MYTFQCWNNQNETILVQYIEMWYSKWWYEGKYIPLVGFLLKSPKKYIIMTKKLYNSSFTEESRYITVRSPPSLINQENETICYFNATNQILYYNVIIIQLILNIDCYTIMIILDKNNKQCAHH